MNKQIQSELLVILSCTCAPVLAQVTPILGLSGGWGITSDLGDSTQFNYGFSQYHYDNQPETQKRGVFGAQLGLEWVFHPSFALQTTLAYYRMAPFTAEGVLTQGVTLAGSTPFDYHYQISSQQVMIENKILFQVKEKYHPYIAIGLGTAFNHQESYDIDYPANLIFTPFYDDKQNTAFTYAVGFGLDYQLVEDVRLGLSYRFADLGEASLGQRTLDPINPIAIPGTLEQSHLYVQEILFQLTLGS